MVRLQVVLDPAEADALARLATLEMRDPRDQIRMVLRRELEKCGLLVRTDDERRRDDLEIRETGEKTLA